MCLILIQSLQVREPKSARLPLAPRDCRSTSTNATIGAFFCARRVDSRIAKTGGWHAFDAPRVTVVTVICGSCLRRGIFPTRRARSGGAAAPGILDREIRPAGGGRPADGRGH